ncbi:MAG: VOC family protein [Rhizomicrobium sp.]
MRLKVTTCLWFDGNAQEAAKFYVSIFKNSKITSVSHFPEGTPRPKGSVMTVEFELDGHHIMALNGGPNYKLSPAVSLCVDCDTQAEIDQLWDKLVADGEESGCGWLIDKFGLSWQLVPKELLAWMTDKAPEKAKRVTLALMQMKKIDIKKLQDARDGLAA